MLWYIPIEAYPERYTAQLSAPGTGWMERNWRKADIPYIRIEYSGSRYMRSYTGLPPQDRHIEEGQVLDASFRCRHAMSQVNSIIELIQSGEIKPDDVLYFDDFWHPGLEAIRYYCDAAGKKCPRMYSFLFAQSVDEYDFTYKMKGWIRSIERSYARMYDGIFVASTLLGNLVERGFECQNVHVVGLPFCIEEVRERMGNAVAGHTYKNLVRENKIVFSSRWDLEKQPGIFMRIMEDIWDERPDVKAVICTSQPILRSNDPQLLEYLSGWAAHWRDRVIIKQGLTKEQYYLELMTAKIQINTSLQDWVSYTLLEALCAGAYPIYPNFRSFPEVFMDHPEHLYGSRTDFCTSNYPRVYSDAAVHHASKLCLQTLESSPLMWSPERIEERLKIAKIHDNAWREMADIMGVSNG